MFPRWIPFRRHRATGCRKVLNALFDDDDERRRNLLEIQIVFLFRKVCEHRCRCWRVASWINAETRVSPFPLSMSFATLHFINIRNFCWPFYSFRILSQMRKIREHRNHSAAYWFFSVQKAAKRCEQHCLENARTKSGFLVRQCKEGPHERAKETSLAINLALLCAKVRQNY